ncbi:MAG: bifunctional hexulose-6-phosphate synthase/ribonuclease regulator [Methanomicrobium sp.]|nr:bifunctional hexulose-6-phosphate synthase/ribonuclease regulator [Methanomicrobium sp.]MDD4300056.1 bifunctional hexulose-6-phosphate synthase/ribonuclease regulator [Methanomicrobium sp.]
MSGPILQVALDLTELKRAVQIGKEAVSGGADWIEAGTPLIKSEGMNAVRTLKAEFPNHTIVADMKIADTGALEVEMAAKAGADVVCVLAASDDSVIEEAVRAGRLYGVKIMADLLNAPNPLKRAEEMERMGVDIIAAHIGIDQQMKGMNAVDLLKEISGSVSIPVGAAGGLDSESAAQAVLSGADILLVGSSITKSADVKAAAKAIRDSIDRPEPEKSTKKSRDDEIRDIFMSVSAPNITDAMLRKGAMSGLMSICGNVRMVGRALTVSTVAGDWAKPVEAIDIANEGDVLVIDNQRAKHIAPWGELATHSCLNRGITGVVIDGAVRDADDIKGIGLPVFATAVCPNAGEPKGFGEIGAEISCCGQQVRTGDWIVGDESGVVVIPKERAYEIARRALEVRRNEVRIREEIKRGATLSSISELLRWEKK